MRITRREALKAAALAAAGMPVATFSTACAAQPANAAPNIIFILADDLGYGDLGCYGQKQILTPNIDRMAAEGMRFTDCYSGSTVCAPSRCSLMTGYHTGHSRIRGNARVPLLPEDVTVAKVLKQAGYATGIFGKWGLGEADTTGIPNRQGFDEWFGYLNQSHAHNYYPVELWDNEKQVTLEGNKDGKKRQYSHDLVTEKALAFVNRKAGKPFFLYLAYTIPHANNELGAVTGNGMEVPDDAPYSDKPWPQQQKNHAAMITRMDKDVGRLLALMQKLGIDENTVVFFSSDNGPHKEGGAKPEFFQSGGPLRGIKRDLYDGGIRVPMIARWPGRIKSGAVSDQIWAFWDFLPTAAELAGTKPPDGIDGISMAPALLGGRQRDHEYLYWEFHEGGFFQAVRMGKWKGVRYRSRSEPVMLFDMTTDIGERNDLAKKYPDIAAKMTAVMQSARTDSPDFPIRERK
ncbi:MAG TPA: arylsulfatase [Candidatus Brocadiia bacterium]|nr:arylsulfatase [Candidatus Brocadiia bacterium]